MNTNVVIEALSKAETLSFPADWPVLASKLDPVLDRIYTGKDPARAALENLAREWRGILGASSQRK